MTGDGETRGPAVRTLLFIAGPARRPNLGGFDIWMSTRTVNGKEEQ